MRFAVGWKGDRKTQNGKMIVTVTKIPYSLTILSPNWTDKANAPQADQTGWDTFTGEVTKHEQGHVTIYNNGMAAVIGAVVNTSVTINAPGNATDNKAGQTATEDLV